MALPRDPAIERDKASSGMAEKGLKGIKARGGWKRGEREIRTRSTRRVVTFSPGL